MSDNVIIVENLSKSYMLSHSAIRSDSYTSLRDVLSSNVRSLSLKVSDIIAGRSGAKDNTIEEFWALKEVSFHIKRGDRVGIIGRNGAGKSTLLKLLSRITEPTSGHIQISGRVSSLLEVGTGFHPELTGRENIFLNGAILGMKRREIQRKFDEIVDFAEVEKFLDTPVKRYSSGMYVRLAFAVAAHLEPEILIVDEVLAVGDAEFQKKCLGKMDEVSNQGRTVLFVSHNMDAIERLCGKVIWLQNGSILQNSSNVSETLKHYLHGTDAFSKALEWIKPHGTKSSPYFDLLKLRITDVNGNIAPRIFARDTIMQIRLEAHIDLSDKGLNIGYAIYSDDGTVIYWSCTTDSEEAYWPVLTPGTNLLVTALPIEILNEGNYTIEVMASLHNRQWIIEPRKTNINIAFEISGRLSKSPFWFSKRPGVIAPVYRWNKVHEY